MNGCILLIRLWFQNVSPSSMVVPTGGRRTAAGQSGAVTSATHLRGIPAPSPIPATGSVPQHNHSLLQGQPGEIQPPLIICILLISQHMRAVALVAICKIWNARYIYWYVSSADWSRYLATKFTQLTTWPLFSAQWNEIYYITEVGTLLICITHAAGARTHRFRELDVQPTYL